MSMMRKQGCLLLLFILIAAPLYAQVNDSLKKEQAISEPVRRTNYRGYELSGKVTDAEDGQPIPFAPVFFQKRY